MTVSAHILVIDDEASLRATLARILQTAGYQVTTAESAEQGIAFLQTTKFDLIFTDLRMPGIPGLDALKMIHANHPYLPVVLFTAQPDLNSAVEAMRYGATDYLLKPLKPQAILDRTHDILVKQQIEDRKREIARQIESLQTELRILENGATVADVSKQVRPDSERYIKHGALELDIHARRVFADGEALTLPPTSFDYLLVLARHSPDVVQYQNLVAEAQGYQADPREAQELSKWHIHQLRNAIEKDPHNPQYLINVRGTGYRLVA